MSQRNTQPARTVSPARARLENASRGPLQALNRLPKALLVIAMAALLVAGMMLPAMIGAACLVVLGLFLGWLLLLSWPVLVPGARMMRLATVGIVFFAAYWRATGRA